MTRRLCKLSRHESLGNISQLVAQPEFVCRSCHRAAADKGSLCKPQRLPEVQQAALAVAPESVTDTSLPAQTELPVPVLGKKALKKQKKRNKQLKKLLKKQTKLVKKMEKLERRYACLEVTRPPESRAQALH